MYNAREAIFKKLKKVVDASRERSIIERLTSEGQQKPVDSLQENFEISRKKFLQSVITEHIINKHAIGGDPADESRVCN